MEGLDSTLEGQDYCDMARSLSHKDEEQERGCRMKQQAKEL